MAIYIFQKKSNVICSLFLGDSSGDLALEGRRRFQMVRFPFYFPFSIQISNICSSSVATVLAFTASSAADERRHCAPWTKLRCGLRGRGARRPLSDDVSVLLFLFFLRRYLAHALPIPFSSHNLSPTQQWRESNTRRCLAGRGTLEARHLLQVDCGLGKVNDV